MRPILLALTAFLLLTFASPARALTPPSPPEAWEEWRALGDGVVRIRTTSTAARAGGAPRTTVVLGQLDQKLAPTGDAVTVYDGAQVATALAVRDGAAA